MYILSFTSKENYILKSGGAPLFSSLARTLCNVGEFVAACIAAIGCVREHINFTRYMQMYYASRRLVACMQDDGYGSMQKTKEP